MNFDEPFGNYKCEFFNISTIRDIYRGSAPEYVDDLIETADDWRISGIRPLDCNVQVLYDLEEDPFEQFNLLSTNRISKYQVKILNEINNYFVKEIGSEVKKPIQGFNNKAMDNLLRRAFKMIKYHGHSRPIREQSQSISLKTNLRPMMRNQTGIGEWKMIRYLKESGRITGLVSLLKNCGSDFEFKAFSDSQLMLTIGDHGTDFRPHPSKFSDFDI